jgi:hypothetical protein
MPRPPLPLGTYGKIKTWKEGDAWLARAQFRDFDGIVRPVKRSGKTKAAAERALRTALVERQAPVKQSEITAQTKIEQVAELWLAEIEQAVDAGSKSPSTLDAYRTIYHRHVKPALVGCGCVKWIPRPWIGCWLRSRTRPSAERGRPRS